MELSLFAEVFKEIYHLVHPFLIFNFLKKYLSIKKGGEKGL